jgi:proline iminopeptidase
MKEIRIKKTHKKTKRRLKKQIKTKKLNKLHSNTYLFPPIKPNSTEFIQVSKQHKLYVETYGTSSGKPVLYVHGGPGAGINPSMARFFNPKKYFIILVDQRGSGKSIPSGELTGNTSKNLINDFEVVRKHFLIKKWMVYGGSWGSTLSLAYAFCYPERTTELIIRGVFFCTPSENKWISEPGGAQRINPDGWEYYKSSLPQTSKKIIAKTTSGTKFMKEFKKCFYSGTPRQRNKCLLAWSVWEESLSSINRIPLKTVIQHVKSDRYKQTSKIELQYFENNCFFPNGYFTNPKNLQKIKHIPITIVQGMYDMITPFETAYKLHKLLPHSRFFPTMAGHTAMDNENIKYLVKATNYYALHDKN